MKSPIEEYRRELLDKIPVSRAMGIEIETLSDRHVRVSAPLKENINYQGTAFGGSLNAVAILTCYLMLHHFLRANQVPFKQVVIKSGEIKFLKPVTADFLADCEWPESAANLLRDLKSKLRGQVELTCQVRLPNDETPRVVFRGVFVITTA